MIILEFLPLLFAFFAPFLFTLFYLDEFKLSKNKYIRFIQILYPILFILIALSYILYADVFSYNVISFAVDKNVSNTVNVGASIEVSKDAAESLGTNIGMGGTIGTVAVAVSRSIAKSPIPPLQKAGIVVGSAAGGGAIFVGTNVVNRISIAASRSSGENTQPITTSLDNSGSNFPDGGVNKLLDDSTDSFSDLMLLILSIDTLACVCLNLFLILFMMILFKFFFEDNIKLNFSRFIGEKFNNSLNYYLIKLIQLNKKTSTVYIFIIFIVLFIVLAFNIYFISQLYLNLDTFIDLHIKNRK